MSKHSITLSPKHGLNPSITHCECCGKEIGLALFGKMKGDKMMMEEFREITDKLADLVKYGGDIEPACERCPYEGRCSREELYWGCSAFEQSMGDDL